MKRGNLLLTMFCFMGLFSLQAQITLSGNNYTQDFDGIGDGLPNGWTARTGASSTDLGVEQNFVTNTTTWTVTTGNFRNVAAAEDPLESSSANTAQAQSTDRAFGLRQTGSFADSDNALPAFTCQIENTLDFADFQLTFKLMQCDPGNAGRTVSWIVEYAIGNDPDLWNTVSSDPTELSTTQGTWGSENVTVDFGNALNNISETVWIRIRAAAASTGSGSRPHTAIDDFVLTFDNFNACEAPMMQAFNLVFEDITDSSVAVSWMNGSGDGRIVVMNTENSFTNPIDGSNPIANTQYSGGEQVVYNGSSSGPITVSGLSPNTEYWCRVYEFCEPDRVYQTEEYGENPASFETENCVAEPGFDVIVACEPIIWLDGNTYESSNSTATYMMTTNQGCDSLVTLDLTLTQFEAEIFQDGETLFASPTGASYQWIDCGNNDAPISGATDPSFTATESGNYAVIVTWNTCSEQSDCVEVLVDINALDNQAKELFSLYPNPAKNQVVISGMKSSSKIEILDASGKLILTHFSDNDFLEISTTTLISGLYFVRVTSSHEDSQIQKLVIH